MVEYLRVFCHVGFFRFLAARQVANQVKGKDVEKTLKLAENVEYMDSTGKVATVDIFTSGDLVLIVEREGTITKMTKKDKSDTKKKSDSK